MADWRRALFVTWIRKELMAPHEKVFLESTRASSSFNTLMMSADGGTGLLVLALGDPHLLKNL